LVYSFYEEAIVEARLIDQDYYLTYNSTKAVIAFFLIAAVTNQKSAIMGNLFLNLVFKSTQFIS